MNELRHTPEKKQKYCLRASKPLPSEPSRDDPKMGVIFFIVASIYVSCATGFLLLYPSGHSAIGPRHPNLVSALCGFYMLAMIAWVFKSAGFKAFMEIEVDLKWGLYFWPGSILFVPALFGLYLAFHWIW